ncbi:cobalt-precorrin 7 C15-methyltransferase [Natranaerovirga hydrolytica]|uniref:Cobalt-precorrin 7 C15-methyltransferase n=1 Tax=Natranaerovirga hydrolytica TaxID=680378 RepID=A0A4R1MZA5_9FIRM|nr:precorrin-6Y C5,15-methyltransferase (decarboxylating) subunit CbiT [Natranaerovirga hydrolytica]TCK98657.1 cobalt-precorrin 7 C15-methyltransferase [Natranaerovirga hydrolytica]
MTDHNTFGISDDAFIRGNIPMTKCEIRTITLSKLQIPNNGQILDIGCGTGSITVECGRLANKGEVIAIDQKEEAIYLTTENVKKFQLNNVTTLLGQAPQDLPNQVFDRIFLGGGSKKVEGILEYVYDHLKPKGIFVANTILLESTYKILNHLERYNFEDIQCIQVQISKGEGKIGWMMKAYNPIYIISARKI